MRSQGRALLFVVLVLASCRRTSVPEKQQSVWQGVPAVPVASPALARSAPAEPAILDAPAAAASALAADPKPTSACVAQPAQPFLIEAHLRNQALMSARAHTEWWTRLQRSIRYRTEQYGYYKGFGLRAWNPRPLANQMRVTKFAGLSLVLHERVIPALQCVEQAIERDCRGAPYRPRSLAGMRQNNTYFGGDVSNHVYGIALDIDPNDNPCCNCVEPWRSNPRCRGKKSDWQRMAMPECWVTAFERHGFYWLGHDELKDTMHFEFLGDPSKSALALAP